MNSAKVVIFCGIISLAYASYAGEKVYRLEPTEDRHVEAIKNLYVSAGEKLDFWGSGVMVGKPLLVRVPMAAQEDFQLFLQGTHIPHEVTIEDVQQEIDAQAAERASRGTPVDPYDIDFEQYHEYDVLMGWVDRIAGVCGSRCSVRDVGTSFEGRTLKVIKITGDGSATRSVFVDAGIHAREWIAPATAVWIINEFVKNYSSNAEIRAAVNRFDWYFMVVANPDGYQYTWTDERMWRKTRGTTNDPFCTGTDGNRNFDFAWSEPGSSSDPCSDTYHGDSAFSEPETGIIRDELQALRQNLTGYLAVHSAGQWWLHPWSYSYDMSPDHDEQLRVADAVTDAIAEVHGETYVGGPGGTLLYLASGVGPDWAYATLGVVYSYTPELRDDGFWGHLLPPEYIRPTGEEILNGVLAMAREMRIS